MSFETLGKPELAGLVEKKTGAKPSEKLSKAQLIDLLEAEGFPVIDIEKPTVSDLEIISEPEDEGMIKIVKLDEQGQVIDISSTNKDAWSMLPDHKYGWTIAPPKEIQ